MNLIKRNKKGVAGMNIFLSVIATIFVAGIIIMAFQLTGAKLKESTTDVDAIEAINNTMLATKGATDFFPIFIVIAAIVVIILLLVIVVVSLRQSGLMGAGGA